MGKKFFDQVSGTIKVNLKGKKQEKVINMALSRGIYIWGIKKVNDNIQFKVRNSGFDALKGIADESGHEIEVIEEEGLPFLKNVIKRRMGFLTGALIFVIALYLISSFVWFVEVTGNENIPTNRILVTAAKYGVYQGAAKWSFSRSEVEEAILRDISDLSYVKVDIRGVKAKIQVVEKVLPKKEITGPCHIVATKDGIIEDILVLEGQSNVEKGDVVAKGDILISGIVFPEENPYLVKPEGEEEIEKAEPYLVRARGTVKAKVWYEGYGECRLMHEEEILTENKQTRMYLVTPWKTIMVKGRYKENFDLQDKKITKKIWQSKLGDFGYIKEVSQEKIINKVKYTEKEATKIAQDKATKTLKKNFSRHQEIIDTKVEVLSSPSDPILRVKVSVETIENIAVPEPININN